MQGENQVGDAGAMAIGEALKVNSSVQKLFLVRLLTFFFFVSCVGCMSFVFPTDSHFFSAISARWPLARSWFLFSLARLQKSGTFVF